jgi:hypothetical protein
MYSYAYDDSYEAAIHEADEDDGTVLSTATVADWFSHCRDVILHDFDEGKSQRGKIGGPGKIVQIDESKVSAIILIACLIMIGYISVRQAQV